MFPQKLSHLCQNVDTEKNATEASKSRILGNICVRVCIAEAFQNIMSVHRNLLNLVSMLS